MKYTVQWKVNDGKDSYPNIMSMSGISIQKVRSYEDAIIHHAVYSGVLFSNHGLEIKEIGRERKKLPYRDYYVTYSTKLKDGWPVMKRVRVFFGSYET